MKNSTRRKVEEAKYFLHMMKQTFEDDDCFSYNLSAFLSAARSITYHMQKQYKRRSGFTEWYCQKQIGMSADSELQYLNNARVENVHKETAQTGATRERTVSLDVIIGEVTPQKEQVEEAVSEPPTPSSYPTARFFPDLKDGAVIEFCERQLVKYEELVEECEQRLLKQPNN
ncbi:MAG: hypothetical protein PHI12_06995 [Dehalococcoidales bacterium]|nr:hypothetical protein [Dehalococcoidales bacterium]